MLQIQNGPGAENCPSHLTLVTYQTWQCFGTGRMPVIMLVQNKPQESWSFHSHFEHSWEKSIDELEWREMGRKEM